MTLSVNMRIDKNANKNVLDTIENNYMLKIWKVRNTEIFSKYKNTKLFYAEIENKNSWPLKNLNLTHSSKLIWILPTRRWQDKVVLKMRLYE